MAWTYEYYDDYSGYLSDDYSVPIPLEWGRFSVVELRINPSIENVIIALSSIPELQEGVARGYICTSFNDFINADEVPTNYIATFGPDKTDSVNINVAMVGNLLYAVMAPWSMYTYGWVRFNLTIDGGGGGSSPYYIAQGNDSNGTIDIEVNNYLDLSYSTFVYHIQLNGSSLPSYETSSPRHTFGSLEDGEYTVFVTYYYNGNEFYIPSQSGTTFTDITISGGGGSTDPTFTAEPYGNDGIRVVISDPSGIITGKTCVVSIDGIQRSPDVPSSNEWITTGWAAGTYTITVDYADGGWISIAYTGGGYSTTVTVSGSGTYPTYTAEVVEYNKIRFTVSNRGSYYLRYFVRLTNSPQTTIYDTWSEYGYLTTNTLLTVSNLQYNTSYTVNVGYSTTNSSGTVTWIGSQVLTTGAQSFTYTLISGITVSNSNPSPKRISFNSNNGVIVPITISYNGIITIYTETDQSSRMDDQAYLCTSSNVSYDSAGVVDSTSQYYIKSDDESHGNNQFQMTINNTNVGTNTYYLYIRGYPDSGDNNIPRAINTLLYAILPDGYVYIYDGSSWRKAVPYIYDGSTWRKAIPYIYDGNSWKKTTG